MVYAFEMEAIGILALAIAVIAAVVAAYARGRIDGLNSAFEAMDEADYEAFCQDQANQYYENLVAMEEGPRYYEKGGEQ